MSRGCRDYGIRPGCVLTALSHGPRLADRGTSPSSSIRPTCSSGTALHSSLAVTGSVITSAGLVLAGTFSVLAVLPSVG